LDHTILHLGLHILHPGLQKTGWTTRLEHSVQWLYLLWAGQLSPGEWQIYDYKGPRCITNA